MSRRIICTVGTSLLTNADRPWHGWGPNQPLPKQETVTAWLKTADAEKASAETNTLRAFGLDVSDVLVFLHSDTDEGRFCAEALREHYQSCGFFASVEKIVQLGYGARSFTRGLKGLVDVVLRLVREGTDKRQVPVLAATGGFKAEIAFLNLLGALLGVEVVYLHELHRELVRLPRLPLSWNDAFVAEHERFFQWIDEQPRRSEEVESWLKAAPDLRFLVEDDDDGHTMLSAAGDLLFKAAKDRRSIGPRAEWPHADPRPPAQKNKVSRAGHHRPKGWEQLVNRLCHIDCVSVVCYDDSARGRGKVSVMDADKGVLGVRFGERGAELPLRVETTARGAEQSELVARYLETLLR